eukprot:3945126-Pyramimonas_sp.AAC.1
MSRGKCPPQNAAGAASLGGGSPRFPREAGPVANPGPPLIQVCDRLGAREIRSGMSPCRRILDER